MRKYSKIGILGGTFDPIHLGHTAIAQMAAEQLGLDLVLFVPAKLNPFKTNLPLGGDKERCFMICEAIKDNPIFEIWEKELELPSPSYTINTLTKLFEDFEAGEWFFLIGSDNLSRFTKWHKWEEILDKLKLAVCMRPEFDLSIPQDLPKDRVSTFIGPNWGVSSSFIREQKAKGRTCRYLLNEDVCRFISTNKLYR